MDWGLFDRNAGENTLLREEIVYPQKVSGTLLCTAVRVRLSVIFAWTCFSALYAFTLCHNRPTIMVPY